MAPAWVAAVWHPRAIDHYLANDGGDGYLALPEEEAGVGNDPRRSIDESQCAFE